MRNKVNSQTRIESSIPCKKCGSTTVEIINTNDKDKRVQLKCSGCDCSLLGDNLFELLTKWEEKNSKND